MADPATTPTGKQFSFSLIGDDLHLYNTCRDLIEGEAGEAESKVTEALESLDPAVRALVQARFAPKPKKDISQRQVFVTALGVFLAQKEAEADADEDEEVEDTETDEAGEE